jgi:3-oxoacyl-[acyl-carrier-protein] synthase-3
VPATAILGIGHRLPARLVTNEDLARRLGVTPARLDPSTGITRRYYVEPGTAPSDLAAAAARPALDRAGLTAEDLDLLVFATMTPDVAFPGSGCFLQEKIGARPVGALDIRAQCLGFLFGLLVADRLLRTGAYRHVLLAAAEVHSTSLDFSPAGAGVSPFFGDGGAAVVLGQRETGGLRAVVVHTDATDYEQFWCEHPASRQHPVRMTLDDLREGRHYPRLRLAELDARAASLLRSAIGEVLETAGVRDREVARYLLHYVHPRAALETAARMGIGAERVRAVGQRAGHIAAAGLPLALSEGMEAGEIRPGDLVCLAAVGAGINWGAALLEV